MKTLVSEKLEKIRKERKISRRELHDISGFKEPTIVSYEKGINQPSNEYLDFISLYFGYTKDSILDNKTPKLVKMDKMVNTLLMYQSIFNYTDEKMAELLGYADDCAGIDIKDIGVCYRENLLNNEWKPSKKIAKIILETAKALNIKFSLLSGYGLDDEIKSYMVYGGKEIGADESDYKDFFNQVKKILETQKEVKELEKNGLNITPEYYASIIKKRNNPETITPLNAPENIPPKHQELLSLLRFAPDSFTDEIIAKLKAMQKLQNLQ